MANIRHDEGVSPETVWCVVILFRGWRYWHRREGYVIENIRKGFGKICDYPRASNTFNDAITCTVVKFA